MTHSSYTGMGSTGGEMQYSRLGSSYQKNDSMRLSDSYRRDLGGLELGKSSYSSTAGRRELDLRSYSNSRKADYFGNGGSGMATPSAGKYVQPRQMMF